MRLLVYVAVCVALMMMVSCNSPSDDDESGDDDHDDVDDDTGGDDDDDDDDDDNDTTPPDDDDDDDTTPNPWADYEPLDTDAPEDVTPTEGFAVPGDPALELVDGGLAGNVPPAALWDAHGRPTVWVAKGGVLTRFTPDDATGSTHTFGYPASKPAGATGADGRAKIVYADTEARVLYLLEETATGWQRTVLDRDRDFRIWSVAVDEEGAPHVAYGVAVAGRSSTYPLYHATRWGGTWWREPIDEDAQHIRVRIAAGGPGKVAVAFTTSLDGVVAVHPNGGAWSTSVIFAGEYYAPNPYESYRTDCASIDVAVDPAGGAYVAANIENTYSGWPMPPMGTSTIKVYRVGGDEPATAIFSGPYSLTDEVSLGFTSAGVPHVVFSTGLALADYYLADDRWTNRVAARMAGNEPDLAVGPDDRLLVGHYSPSRETLELAVGDAAGWENRELTTTGRAGAAASVYTDEAGEPTLLYEMASPAVVRVARREGAAWARTDALAVADPEILAGSSAMDGVGKLHLLYHDSGPNNVFYATDASGGWETESVYYQYGSYSLAVDGADRPYVVYDDGLTGTLGFRIKDGDTWTNHDVDLRALGISTGSYPHVVAAGGGVAHIVMDTYDLEENRGITFLSNESGAWEATLLHTSVTGWSRGMDIELSPAGEPRILAAEGSDLIFFARDGDEWHEEYVTALPATTGDLYDVSLLVDANDEVDALVCTDLLPYYAGTMHYLSYRDGTWSERVVATQYGGSSGLAAGSGDTLYAAYTARDAVWLARIPKANR